jgi:hypothetical protein
LNLFFYRANNSLLIEILFKKQKNLMKKRIL